MSKVIGMYGAGGCGREVLPLVREQYSGKKFCFIVDSTEDKKEINGSPVYTYQQFLDLPHTEKSVIFSIANSKVRQSLEAKCKRDNLLISSVTASNVVVLDAVEIGEGAVLCHFTRLASNIKIGKQFHANAYSYVSHDCIIGDYVTFAPGVHCNGNVHIEDHAYIGTGAIIKQGTLESPLVIGKGAVVGTGLL